MTNSIGQQLSLDGQRLVLGAEAAASGTSVANGPERDKFFPVQTGSTPFSFRNGFARGPFTQLREVRDVGPGRI